MPGSIVTKNTIIHTLTVACLIGLPVKTNGSEDHGFASFLPPWGFNPLFVPGLFLALSITKFCSHRQLPKLFPGGGSGGTFPCLLPVRAAGRKLGAGFALAGIAQTF